MPERTPSKPASGKPAALFSPSEKPTVASVLCSVPKPRLLNLYRLLGCEVRDGSANREQLTAHLERHLGENLPKLLRELGRDELRAVCRSHGLDSASPSRTELQAIILTAAGFDPSASQRPHVFRADGLPTEGQVVHTRHRQWLVESVHEGEGQESALVRLVCLDDDDPGRQLDVLWNLELGARIVATETNALGDLSKLDPPEHFGAYLHALKWSAVSAADATRFQAPFRAGIKLMAHQLTPLMKALELPRANLFIADDVGLGKTIEAGLVLQELILRQQANLVLIVCPASICLQWQTEMQRRFGLRFEVMTRQFVAYRRQERGFGINPWSTHNRFIISHALIRRPEYREPLLHHLGERARKSLLILDEAHVAAPASASKYATDTDTTRTIRDLAPRFDNRLFLSATPHNGHSNSFSALLEILDPVRFTRGVPVEGKSDLEPIMVRRLKRDLRKLGVEKFPRRDLVQIALSHQNGVWHTEIRSYDAETGEEQPPVVSDIGKGEPTELILGERLRRYTELCAPASGAGRLPFIRLQQRLLSSPEAFARTVEVHAASLAKKGGPIAEEQLALKARGPITHSDEDPEVHGITDEALEEEDAARIRKASESLPSPTEEARHLLSEMRALAAKARRQPDAKTLALFAWLREHACPAIGLGPDTQASREWSERRVIVFTEFGDTKRYLLELLGEAIADTDDAESRIVQYHGGMGDEARDEVQRAFNSPPGKHPARILIATDAAREGVNLQAHCTDLFHFDIPWNPARMEQRNGRIDRTLQPASVVRCHYFVFPDRKEDKVLETVVRKIAVVQRELGSLGAVVLDQIEDALQGGITDKAGTLIEKVGDDPKKATVQAELEGSRDDRDALLAEVNRAAHRLEASRRILEVEPESLKGVVEVGLKLAGAEALTLSGATSDNKPSFTLPSLDRSWDPTLDSLRPPRSRSESFWEWRNQAPRPVTFHPLASLSEDAEQLHLAHPFVKRILDRFLAQGFSAHDLSRVTALVAPDESVIRLVAYARLTLFGAGAARLHDQLVPLAAAWSGSSSSVQPYKDRETGRTAVRSIETLLARSPEAPNETIAKRIREHAGTLFSTLWPHLEAEADALAVEAKQGLVERARRESDELRKLLSRQRKAIDKAESRLRQEELFNVQNKEQKKQVDLDLKHLERRREKAASEMESEPKAIEALYEVCMTRLSPVGLVVAWPESMT